MTFMSLGVESGSVPMHGKNPDGTIRCLEQDLARERHARAQAEALLAQKSKEFEALKQKLSSYAVELEMRVEERTVELVRARERALALAERDQLTGLPNRIRFAQALDEAIDRRRPTIADASNGEPDRFALFLIDLDRFKEINDSLGYPAGDLFLQQSARRLREVLGEGAQVARLGGDEFAAIVPIETRGNLEQLCDTVVQAIHQPIAYRSLMMQASCSLGVAVFPDDTATKGELLRYADIALYRSKAIGCGWTRFQAQLGKEIDGRQALASDLGDAFRSGAITTWFQPIIDSATCRTIGAEALARWIHPSLGLLSPAAFLGVIEEQSLMSDLFASTMRCACPPARKWIRSGAIKSLSVNLSPSQFKFGSVADDVIALLQELDFPPHALTIEITEEVLLTDLDRARAQLERIAAHGVRIALDDFGIGYSNIAYLRQLPIQTLKLDRLLTKDVAKAPQARAILGAVVQIARALDLTLVAEGVEETDQADGLTGAGCEFLQGYLFGQPMPEQDFAGFIGFEEMRGVA